MRGDMREKAVRRAGHPVNEWRGGHGIPGMRERDPQPLTLSVFRSVSGPTAGAA